MARDKVTGNGGSINPTSDVLSKSLVTHNLFTIICK